MVLLPVDIDSSSTSTSLAALGASGAVKTSSDPSTTLRAWREISSDENVTHRLDEALLSLRDILRRDRYHVSISRAYLTSSSG